jgi:hypothetical protein
VRAPIATACAAHRFSRLETAWSFEERKKTQEGDLAMLNAWRVAVERENPMVSGRRRPVRTGWANQRRSYRFAVESSNVTSMLAEARDEDS